MSKTPSSETIVKGIVADLNGSLPTSTDELAGLLTVAARQGKISGLRRARKAVRGALMGEVADPFEVIESSIRSTYKALGADTDAYEADQRERHPERYGLTVPADDTDTGV